MLIVGVVDMGQFANCHQKISDACREGARCAAQFETADTSDVETVVLACLGDMFPTVPEATLRSGTTVTVRNAAGCTLVGSELGNVSTGAPVEVQVSLPFNNVRWISGLQFLGGRTMNAATVMRRE